jgi:cytochrome c553
MGGDSRDTGEVCGAPEGAMKRIYLAALLAAILVSAISSAAHTDDFQNKVQYCQTCHGLSGQGYRGFFDMPRLAGQQPEYLENQLRAFAAKRRINPIMTGVARSLSPSMRAALANHFKNVNAATLGGVPREHIDQGRTIFADGLPESNVPACSACHGTDGHGHGEIPRLAGQLFPYVVNQLRNWQSLRGPGATDVSAIMGPTAHNLTSSQIAAVAAYVSNLK